MDNKERFKLLHETFGLEKVLSDSYSVKSFVRNIDFAKNDVMFLKFICSPESCYLKDRILDLDSNIESDL